MGLIFLFFFICLVNCEQEGEETASNSDVKYESGCHISQDNGQDHLICDGKKFTGNIFDSINKGGIPGFRILNFQFDREE
jgi:hypothetical protein